MRSGAFLDKVPAALFTFNILIPTTLILILNHINYITYSIFLVENFGRPPLIFVNFPSPPNIDSTDFFRLSDSKSP